MVRTEKVETVNITKAKATLGELVDRAASGEPTQITRHGKPVAQIIAIATKKKPIKLEDLQRVTAKGKYQKESAGTFVRRMRDTDRY
jgi:prevent-host-death family protein